MGRVFKAREMAAIEKYLYHKGWDIIDEYPEREHIFNFVAYDDDMLVFADLIIMPKGIESFGLDHAMIGEVEAEIIRYMASNEDMFKDKLPLPIRYDMIEVIPCGTRSGMVKHRIGCHQL